MSMEEIMKALENALKEHALSMDDLQRILDLMQTGAYQNLFKDQKTSSEFQDLMTSLDHDFGSVGKAMASGNGEQANTQALLTSIRLIAQAIAKMHALLNDPDLAYTPEEEAEVKKNGRQMDPLNQRSTGDAELDGLLADTQEALDKADNARKIGMRACEKVDQEILKSQEAIEYAQMACQAMDEEIPLELSAENSEVKPMTEEDVQKINEMFQSQGQDFGAEKSLSQYLKNQEKASKEASMYFKRGVVQHPIRFFTSAMQDAISQYRAARQAVAEADGYTSLGAKAVHDIVAYAKSISVPMYSQLCASAAQTAKDFTEAAAEASRKAWEKMTENAGKLKVFLRSTTKSLTEACDRGLEFLTLGGWSRFCSKVEKKAADHINRRVGLDTQMDWAKQEAEKHHGILERMSYKNFEDYDTVGKQPLDPSNAEDRRLYQATRYSESYVQHRDQFDRFWENLADKAARAHAWMIGKDLDFEVLRNESTGNLYAAIGEHIEKDGGDEFFREGNAYWRDVKASVWGEGKNSPAENMADLSQSVHASIQKFGENTKESVKDALEETKNRINAAIQECDFVDEKIETLQGAAALQSRWKEEIAATYEDLGNLALRHEQRVMAKVSKFETLDKQNQIRRDALENALDNFINAKDSRQKFRAVYQPDPVLVYLKDTLMRVEPTEAINRQIQHIDSYLKYSDKKIDREWEKLRGLHPILMNDVLREKLNQEFRNLEQDTAKIEKKLGNAKESFQTASAFRADLESKRDSSLLAAADIRMKASLKAKELLSSVQKTSENKREERQEQEPEQEHEEK